MEIQFSPQATKSWRKIPLAERNKLIKKVALLADNPFLGKILKGEFGGLRSLRVWPYRILYEYTQSRIVVRFIGHRQGVYK